MSIHLFGDYYFDRDPMNWILQKSGISKKTGLPTIKNIAYFGNAGQMADHIANNATLNAPDTDQLNDLIWSIDNLSQLALENIRSKLA
jgi:hypothetical protein